MGDAKDGCFSSLCMGELFGDTLFFGLEYGVSLFDVANLEGMKYLHFWGCWEIYWSFEVFASWDIVWVVSYLGFYAMYFRIWFPAICFCFFVIFFKILFGICFKYSLFILVNMKYFFINVTYQKQLDKVQTEWMMTYTDKCVRYIYVCVKNNK